MEDVIVIGGGPAGVTAALRACELGARVALVERGRLGGICTNDGCVPTRVLARAARLARDAEQFERFGLLVGRPQLDFARLMARVQQVVYGIHEKKQLRHHLEQAGARVYAEAGKAQFADAHTLVLGDGRRLQAKKFILCAGGHARRLAFPGSEHALTHSDVWSLTRLPKSLAIVGGAATGCQLASIFAAFGTRVWMLEIGPRLLGMEDSLVSEAIGRAFERRGIRAITGIGGVERIEAGEGERTLWYQREGASHPITAEVVIMAAGWPGNVEELNLPAAGVEARRGFVVVDDYLRTTAEHIFAAGDITGRMMLVQSAGQRFSHQIVPHGGFTDPEYASVGLTEARARELGSDCLVSVVPFTHVDRAVIDGHPEGACKLIVSQETHRILGAHVVGEQALEIVQLVAAGMAADMWVEQLAELEIAYPTYSAVVGLAARQLVHELGVMPLAPQWRALSKAHAAEWVRSEASPGGFGAGTVGGGGDDAP